MSSQEFDSWLRETGPAGRYELSAGRVIAMAPERMGHNRVKAAVHAALARASDGLHCEAVMDGMSVEINADTLREPDAMLRCGDALPREATRCNDPVIVVEVTSPSMSQTDFTAKLLDYAEITTLAHYIIVDLERRAVIHHARAEGGGFATTLHRAGDVRLDPPGLSLDLDPILAAGD